MTCGARFLYAAATASPISCGASGPETSLQAMPAADRMPGSGRLNGIWAGIFSPSHPRQLARIGSGRPKVTIRERIAFNMFPRPELWRAIAGRAPARYAPADMPTPSSSRVRPMCRNAEGSLKKSPFARSQGTELTRSIPCFLSSPMIWSSSIVCDPLPEFCNKPFLRPAGGHPDGRCEGIQGVILTDPPVSPARDVEEDPIVPPHRPGLCSLHERRSRDRRCRVGVDPFSVTEELRRLPPLLVRYRVHAPVGRQKGVKEPACEGIGGFAVGEDRGHDCLYGIGCIRHINLRVDGAAALLPGGDERGEGL